MARGHTTLGELDHLSIDDTEEMWVHIEWREEQQAKVEARQRRESERSAKKD